MKSIPITLHFSLQTADRSKYRDQNFALALDGNYPALGRSHEFNVGISYQDNKENLSFYEEGESMIPDLRKFDGNIANPICRICAMVFQRMKNLSVYGSTRFKLSDKLAFIAAAVLWIGVTVTAPAVTNSHTAAQTNVFIPYLGVTYDIGDNLTAYASYTTIFRPQVRYLTKDGAALNRSAAKPTRRLKAHGLKAV
ncbi:TonB-dependent receptor [Neisseria subflava]|uniref:TonB-dependent receptor domain-containing protein n=1 Tax=Neisseria subflava TaxID=28449 RepID=UPI00202A9A01|nr:TonB-dependent receptor [Neisseria subflava]MCL9792722.1 TonB-dependent receptor [Neisseria subflava]